MSVIHQHKSKVCKEMRMRPLFYSAPVFAEDQNLSKIYYQVKYNVYKVFSLNFCETIVR